MPQARSIIPYHPSLEDFCSRCPAAESALCSVFDRESRRALEPIGYQIRLGRSECLCEQYAPADRIFNLIEGMLTVERTTTCGQRQIVAFLFPGDFLGLSFSKRYDYTVRAVAPSRACAFKREGFLDTCERFPEIKARVATIHNMILARVLDQLFTLGQKKAHERLSFLLVQLMERQRIKPGEALPLQITRQDIADYLGLTMETVSRAFTRLRNEGLIELTGSKQVRICSPARLRDMASNQ